MAPWHIQGHSADLTFTPFPEKVSATQLGVLSSRTHQCFGHYNGAVADSAGRRIRVANIVGWAKDVHNRW